MDFGEHHVLETSPPIATPDPAIRAALVDWMARGDRSGRARAALARLDAGTWGVCCRCGAPLAVEELQRDPSEPFCASCRDF